MGHVPGLSGWNDLPPSSNAPSIVDTEQVLNGIPNPNGIIAAAMEEALDVAKSSPSLNAGPQVRKGIL